MPYIILFTVEAKQFEPMWKKPRLHTVTESDGMCMIYNLWFSYYPDIINGTLLKLNYMFYTTVEDVDAYEPVRKKSLLDIDQDSAMGLSVSLDPSEKSIEASCR